jgi:hypothetical protein
MSKTKVDLKAKKEAQAANIKTRLQSEIDLLKTQGMVFDFQERGPALGPKCDHCGKDDRRLIDVYAYKPGEKDEDDPVSQLVFLFGSGCIKHFNFK